MTDTPAVNFYRTRPVQVAASRWFKNGDHPQDRVGEQVDDQLGGTYERREGAVVRFYRHPSVPGTMRHCDLAWTDRPHCSVSMNDHGWIDSGPDGLTVCPGDYIVTDPRGEFYPCDPQVFEDAFEPKDDPEPLP